MILVLLKEYLDEDYRDIIEIVEVMDKVKERIGLKHVPFSAQKISAFILRKP